MLGKKIFLGKGEKEENRHEISGMRMGNSWVVRKSRTHVVEKCLARQLRNNGAEGSQLIGAYLKPSCSPYLIQTRRR